MDNSNFSPLYENGSYKNDALFRQYELPLQRNEQQQQLPQLQNLTAPEMLSREALLEMLENDALSQETAYSADGADPGTAEQAEKSSAKTSRDTKFVWRDGLVYYLITQWHIEPCLYDVCSDEYFLKDKRMLALERILNNISAREFHPLPTVQQIQDKMSSLRTYYNFQRNKKRASELSGTGTYEHKVHKIVWPFYDSLSFLSDSTTPKKTMSTIDDEGGYQNRENTPPRPPSVESKRRRKNDSSSPSPLISEATSTVKNKAVSSPVLSKTDDMHFGESLGRLLSGVNEGERKDVLKLELQRMIIAAKYSHPAPQPSPQSPYSAEYTATGHRDYQSELATGDMFSPPQQTRYSSIPNLRQ